MSEKAQGSGRHHAATGARGDEMGAVLPLRVRLDGKAARTLTQNGESRATSSAMNAASDRLDSSPRSIGDE
jgi:hypothetical protein